MGFVVKKNDVTQYLRPHPTKKTFFFPNKTSGFDLKSSDPFNKGNLLFTVPKGATRTLNVWINIAACSLVACLVWYKHTKEVNPCYSKRDVNKLCAPVSLYLSVICSPDRVFKSLSCRNAHPSNSF